MSLESSYEPTEQELLRSTTSADANHNPVVQDDCEGTSFSRSATLGADQEVAIHQVLQNAAILSDGDMAALRRFWDHGDGTGLNQALERWREALNLTSSDAPDGHHNLTNLDETFSICQQVIQASSSSLPEDWSGWLKELGADLRARYEYINYDRVIDLDVAITAIYQQLILAFSSDASTLPNWLNNLGVGLFTRYRVEGEYIDRDAAITAYQQAILVSLPDSPDLPDWLSNLGLGLSILYQDTGKLTDLDAAIAAYQQAVQASSLDSPRQPEWLGDLGAALSIRYNNGGGLTDLDAAITAYQQAVQASLLDSPDRSSWLSNLGKKLHTRYELTGNLADLDAAVAAYQQAIQTSSIDSPDWLSMSNLGLGLSTRYEHTRELADLNAAIAAYQQAVQVHEFVELLADLGMNYLLGVLLSNLAIGLSTRYELTGDLTDLDAAITAYRQAVHATPSDSPDLPWRLNNLGLGLRTRYGRTGDLADLDAAITTYQQAVQAIPPSSPDWFEWLRSLGAALYIRYEDAGDLTDLDTAITVWQERVQATPSNSSDLSGHLSDLGVGLYTRYEHTGDQTDLEAVIAVQQQAIQTAPSNSSDLSNWLNNLGPELYTRYKRTGSLTDLDAAIIAYQQAVQATPSDSSDLPMALSNLGLGLRARYERTGDLTDLEAAITIHQQATQATPSDSPNLPKVYGNLGNGLRTRYQRTGSQTDLDAAITAYQQAVQVTPSDSPDLPLLLSSLAIGLSNQYRRTGDLTDLDSTITVYQKTIQSIPPNSPNLPALLHNLGVGLYTRYEYTGKQTDLDAAIAAYQQAVQATPSTQLVPPKPLNDLGCGLRTRYIHTGKQSDLDAAITAYQQAIQATPPDSPDLPGHMSDLGLGLVIRYALTRDLADLDAAIVLWESGWSIPQLRFAALPVAYQLAQQRQVTPIAANLVTVYLIRAKRHHPHATSIPRRTLEIAEGSKSRLLTQLVGRGPLPLPKGLSPEIAAREQQFLADLITLDTQELITHDYSASAQEEASHLSRLRQRQATLHELENLWNHIAHIGPEGIAYAALRRGAAPTWQEFAHLAKGLGPATVLLSFFTTADRALLFLFRAGWRAPRMVEVLLDQNGWDDLLERFFREIHYYTPGLQRGETWEHFLRPLLTKAQRHLAGVERLILAPEGNGHLLPWAVLAERADWRTSTGQPMPLVTLPALGILPRLQQRPHVSPGSVLIVGDPRGDLSSAEGEANMVAERFETTPLLGGVATKSEVLTRLPNATLIHLATHAFFDAKDPLESGIVLADGVLTAREVLQHRLQADLLVLSACESGRVGSLGGEELAGLSQAFLQTGVRSLLVSLWRVNDPATAALMQVFYSKRQAGADKALALRQAMAQIQRDQRWTHPYYWGAFILIGDWD